MALTESNALERGTTAPDFSLSDTVSGQRMSLQEIKGEQATVIMFICNHCPYVLHINDGLIRLANDYKQKGVSFIAISSNDATNYPQDAPDKMKIQAEKLGYPFPYLYDETQEVAETYGAVCTPDLYVFDKNLMSVYRGQIDDARPSNEIAVTGNDIREVLNTLLADKIYSQVPKPSIGCSIKWK